PASNLAAEAPAPIQFVTLLRDPLRRYLSQYRYWNRVLGKDWSFERFLDHEPSFDFQTRKLAGERDVDRAIHALRHQCALVGTVERLDEFLLQLAALLPRAFDPHYRARNTGESDRAESDRLLEEFGGEIRERNAADLALYAAALEHVLPAQRKRYAGDLERDLIAFRERQRQSTPPAVDVRLLADAALRKGWYEPITGFVRRRNGLPARGSY
ncbi:MAG: hypothetical protein AAFX85_18045, partial [Pseudomonadota bacterium]